MYLQNHILTWTSHKNCPIFWVACFVSWSCFFHPDQIWEASLLQCKKKQQPQLSCFLFFFHVDFSHLVNNGTLRWIPHREKLRWRSCPSRIIFAVLFYDLKRFWWLARILFRINGVNSADCDAFRRLDGYFEGAVVRIVDERARRDCQAVSSLFSDEA